MPRKLRQFFQLMLMDTQLPGNHDLVASIKEEALFDGLFEGFLEAVPQFIFQLSIILRTGVISKFLLNISLLLRYTQGDAYFKVAVFFDVICMKLNN